MPVQPPIASAFNCRTVRRLAGLALTPLVLAGCMLFRPGWHWENPGGDYAQDERSCKTQSFEGTDGMVTQAGVRRMHACLESRGWHKVAD